MTPPIAQQRRGRCTTSFELPFKHARRGSFGRGSGGMQREGMWQGKRDGVATVATVQKAHVAALCAGVKCATASAVARSAAGSATRAAAHAAVSASVAVTSEPAEGDGDGGGGCPHGRW